MAAVSAAVKVGLVLSSNRARTHCWLIVATGKNSSRPPIRAMTPHWFCNTTFVAATGLPAMSARSREVSMPVARS